MSSKSEKKKLAKIREQWGKPKYINRNFNLIAGYLNIRGQSAIAESTANDLDVDGIFAYFDRTSSKPGQQYLYQKLHQPEISEAYFKKLEDHIAIVNKDRDLRDRAQLKLSNLSDRDAYNLPTLFNKQQHPIFGRLATAYICTAPWLTGLLIISLFIKLNQFAFAAALILVVINVGMHYFNKFKVLAYTHLLPQLLILYNTSEWLNDNKLVQDDIDESLANVAKLKKSLGFINVENAMNADPTNLTFMVSEWFKMFLAIEPLVFVYSISRVNKYLDDIKALYEATAKVDMAIAIQSVRDGVTHYCLPQFLPADENITIKDLYHPLIENCVVNSITIDNKQGVLITGSNMSGKTTFIRSVAINALLSQTINTSFATSYSAPPLNILTSIDINDELDESRSYFQVEAISVKNMMDSVANSKPVNSLVIIDEIFRGTNTIERIAAAKAVLSYLIANQSFVFVSTHDLELAGLLGQDYKVFSFEELIGDDRLIFDYKLKEGLLKNRNGIAVLKALGYPDSVIDEANNISITLRNKYDL
ncbi:hypothetical protein [Mucilaginibacter sp. dw_454]|uniref:MutS-related protein n=1 Tax=Mucilaginibacter sp. dw_454 TaxID=2720079 RepID=UPI001BD3D637|nr:hypothetical protein [Mucilaginibacter sp. dw_454]